MSINNQHAVTFGKLNFQPEFSHQNGTQIKCVDHSKSEFKQDKINQNLFPKITAFEIEPLQPHQYLYSLL